MITTIKQAFKSTRVLYTILGAITFYLKTKGILGEPEALLIETILGGLFLTRTLSKFEK